MPRYSPNERDIIDTLQQRIRLLERRVKHLETMPHNTVQEHDKSDVPGAGGNQPSLPNGLIFVATDNDFCWVRDGIIRFVNGTVFP